MVIFVRRPGQAIQLKVVVGLNETLIENEAHHHPNRERSAAKSKAKYLVVIAMVISANEFVDVDDVAFQPIAKSAAKNRQRFEARCADAIVVEGHLIRA